MESMRIIITLLLILSMTPIVAGDSLCQTTDEKLSANEEREVREFARRFSERLQITRDLAPFLNQPLASTMLDRVLADTDNPVALVKRDVALKVGRTELRQFYIAMSNIGYLSDLYLYGKFSLEKTRIRDLSPNKQYPPRVARLMKSNPIIAKWWKESDSSELEKIVESVGQLRSLVDIWQKAAALMRKYFRKHPPEQTVKYQKNLAYLAPYLKEIRIDTCDNEKVCAGLPLHTQSININLPVLQLMLARINGRLEILTVGISDD
jgi:hypothetical protein